MHCVDLGESFPTHIFLQNLASIQRRTSLVKFARSYYYRSPRYSTTLTELIADENAAQKAHEELLRTNEQFRKDTTQTKQAKETEKRQKTERLGNARVELAANRQE